MQRFLSADRFARGRLALTGRTLRRLDRRYPSRRDWELLAARVDFLERVRAPSEAEFTSVDALVEMTRPRSHSHVFERIGGDADGGYILAVDVPLPSGVVSVGVGAEHSADIELARRGVQVEQFDHTVAQPEALVGIPNIHFNPLGLGSADHIGPFVSLAEMCVMGPWAAADDLWLLIDCEGAEVAALAERQDLSRFAQLSIEMHDLERMATDPERILDAIRWLVTGHVPIAMHANNYGAVFRIGGRRVPTAIEITLVRRDLYRHGNSGNPTQLMRPNDPERPEIDLTDFLQPRRRRQEE